MAVKIRSIRSDPRWVKMVARYRFDWIAGSIALFGFSPTPQQLELLIATQPIGSRVCVSSGHGTGKSAQIAIVVLLYMLLYPNARVVLVANTLNQVKTAVWKYIKIYWKVLITRFPWVEDYYTLDEEKFYAIAEKGVWEVKAKATSNSEESLAGEHGKHLLWIIDEASGLTDKTFDYVEGSLTEKDNRIVMLSQPTKDHGYFWEAFNDPDKSKLWTKLTFNCEESPLVTPEFVRNAFYRYGGDREAIQYLIRVRGIFPKSMQGYLLSMDDAVRGTKATPKLEKGWGWVLAADVGNGRDSSVINIARVSGVGDRRRIVREKVIEYEGSIDPVNLGREIVHIVKTGKYPNISVIIDGDGVGADTATICEEKGINVHRLRWGDPMFSKDEKKLYINQRAYASVKLCDAIRAGRVKLDRHSRTLKQASKIPYDLDDMGRFRIISKLIMRTKYNIKSPDRFDTYCFMMLVDVVPANTRVNQHSLEEREHVGGWAHEVTAA